MLILLNVLLCLLAVNALECNPGSQQKALISLFSELRGSTWLFKEHWLQQQEAGCDEVKWLPDFTNTVPAFSI